MQVLNRSAQATRNSAILGVALTLVVAGLVLLPFVVLGLTMPRNGRPAELGVAHTLAVEDGVWRYEDEGSGEEALLLLHGFNQDAGIWDAVWQRLGTCPSRRIRVDLPGFGASRFRSEDFSLPRQGQRLLALLDAIGVKRAALVGVSMGASLSAWFAAEHPERVSRLVLLAPSGYEGALTHVGLFGRLVRPGPLNRAATWLAQTRLFNVLFPRSLAAQALTVSASYGRPWVDALPRIEAPTRVVWARSDPVASAVTAEPIAKAIPRATLQWLDEAAGHSVPQSRPELVADLACGPADGAQR
ncbi:MAG TPA: alpha/beta hydrolase [Burkholderiaceae bacterium]|nr:alpha/beta hydrolase [Burkholderiaceae bacterium]